MKIQIGKTGSAISDPKKLKRALTYKSVRGALSGSDPHRILPPQPFFDSRPARYRGGKWPILGNDKYGCCTFAGIARIGMARAAARGKVLSISDKAVINAYLDSTGGEDSGQQPVNALQHVLTHGIKCDDGSLYKVLAYARVETRDVAECHSALASFGSLYVAAGLPAKLDDDRDDRLELTPSDKWTSRDNVRSLGGHAYNIFGNQHGEEFAVLWTEDVVEEAAWTSYYREEAWVFVDNQEADEKLLTVMYDQLSAIRAA